ncbi:MAG: 3-oxo-5-alpha-steroid 4-dehydrogenase [Spirochaetaceae bacterium]|nr:MAG: 3-oxo-5-alpha-steroid 4-dehydrogenase [Spirochaetaceae bacterium]
MSAVAQYGEVFLNTLIVAWIGVAVGTFCLLFFVTAPYGRHSRDGWGPAIPARVGWILMEAVAPLAFLYFFLKGNKSPAPLTVLFLGFFLLHYLNRAFIYPFRMKNSDRPMAVTVAVMGMFFNSVNGLLNGRYLNLFSFRYTVAWLSDLRFITGVVLFFFGMVINLHSDGILRSLRSDDEPGYKIPKGGAFQFVSCGNYFGELVEWIGWACLTWSLAGLTFAIWTAANLIPRALAHHRWYLDTFPDYPQQRKAIIPYIL